MTLEDIEHFAEFTGDTFYAHMDEEAARANPFFDGRVAHGYLVLSFAAGLFVQPDPGPVLANYGVENLRFLTPVYPGDELTVTLTCKQIIPREDAGHGEVRWDTDVTNQDGASVAKYDVLTMVAKQWPPAGARRVRRRAVNLSRSARHQSRGPAAGAVAGRASAAAPTPADGPAAERTGPRPRRQTRPTITTPSSTTMNGPNVGIRQRMPKQPADLMPDEQAG